MFYLRMYHGASQTGQLFLAVLPDHDIAAEIHRMAAILKRANGFRGQLTEADRLHVTLFSLSGLPEALIADVGESFAQMRAKPFDVQFDRSMSFRGRPGGHPFVLTGDEGLRPLKSFRRLLFSHLNRRGFGFLGRPEYTPHITLLFDDHAAEENPIGPIRWTVRNVVLIRSRQGHRHLARWPLQA